MNKLIEDRYTMPVKSYTQLEVFENQLTKHIKPNNSVAVLSAFPIFIFDYYGRETLEQRLGIRY